MKGLSLFAIVLFAFPGMVCGQSVTKDIDSVLLKDANAIIKEYHVTYDVKSTSDIQKRIKYEVVILNQAGKDMGDILIHTGLDEKITGFSGNVRNSDGSFRSKIKLSNLESRPSYPDYVFLSDNKLFYYYPVIENYPYSVEYEQTIAMSGMLEFDPWLPVGNEYVSCDTSSFTIIYPTDYKINFKESNIPSGPIKEKEKDGRERITWSIRNIPVFNIRSFAPPIETYMPCLFVMPESFFYDNHNGNVTGWNDYGIWLKELLKERDIITPELKERLTAITSDVTDTRSKVTRIYRHLQKNTRYVAIELGIGGLQPAPALEVAKYGYGDCKGLSNYMKSMLAAAGIKSYYTEIGNGSRRIKPSYFSKYQTNHAILCVPDKNDTIWLECTNSYYNAGYLGYSNSNRKALLITEKGGVLVNTPRADSSNSYSRNRFDIRVNNNGSSSYSVKGYCTGKEYEDFLYMKHATKEISTRYMYDILPFRNHSISSYDFVIDSTALAGITVMVEGKFNKYATVAGKRFIVPLVPYRLFDRIPKFEEGRIADIFISKHTARTDTICISIPSGFKINIPEETNEFTNEIGHYEQEIKMNGNEVYILRKVFISPGTYTVDMKEKVTEFYKKSHDIENKSLLCEQAL